jgi:hypothetical protein
MSGNIAILTLTVAAAGALESSRFITQAGAYPAAGAAAFGVTRFSTSTAGDLVSADVQGTAIVEAGAAIAKDAAVMVDGTGRAVPLAGAGNSPVGRSMEAAAAAGDLIEVLLVPSAGLVSV